MVSDKMSLDTSIHWVEILNSLVWMATELGMHAWDFDSYPDLCLL